MPTSRALPAGGGGQAWGASPMKLLRRKFLQVAAGAAALPAVSRLTWAQAYPSRQITMIVPFPPGGSTDVTARVLAERMRPLLSQPVIIENIGGAGGSIGVGRLARAAPDGYTIDLGQWDTHSGNIVYPLTYDLQKDFEQIGLVAINPQLMVAGKKLHANSLGELVAWMKAHPGEAKLSNVTAASQVAGLLLQQATGTRLQFIPYRGAGPAMTDLISGQVLDLMVAQAAVTLPQVRGGTIKAIANLAPQRSATMPDIPTSDESGVSGLHMPGWFGLFAPKGTPKDIIAKLNNAMHKRSPTLPWALALPNWDWMWLRPSSKCPRGLLPSTKRRSRNGGRSLRPRISSRSDLGLSSSIFHKLRSVNQIGVALEGKRYVVI